MNESVLISLQLQVLAHSSSVELFEAIISTSLLLLLMLTIFVMEKSSLDVSCFLFTTERLMPFHTFIIQYNLMIVNIKMLSRINVGESFVKFVVKK